MLNSFQHLYRFLYANKEEILNQVQDDVLEKNLLYFGCSKIQF